MVHRDAASTEDSGIAGREVEHFSVPVRLLRQADNLRLDASYFNPAVVHALEALRRSGMVLRPLGEITARVFIPPRFRRIYVTADYGVPFLQGSHIVHFQPADVKYLSKTAHQDLDRWIIRSGWLLVTCSGTIGRVAICPPAWDGWAASQHILRIVPNEQECPSGYLYSFLASPLGKVQLTNRIYGAVVDELTEDQARSVLVPMPTTADQERRMRRINELAVEGLGVREKAMKIDEQAVKETEGMFPSLAVADRLSEAVTAASSAKGGRPQKPVKLPSSNFDLNLGALASVPYKPRQRGRK